MNILVIGGTRFFGKHLVQNLLDNEHDVTIATRGLTKDPFGEQVHRIVIDRDNRKDLKKVFENTYYDVVYDNIGYCSNNIKDLLEVLHCNHYIFTSSISVYDELHPNIKEQDYSATTNTIIYGDRKDFNYPQGKQQAENTIFQAYKDINATAVRFPLVLGEEDYTNRLYFYIEHIVKQIPMHISNLNARISFINAKDAGHFLSFLATKNNCGAINACSDDTISIKEILRYVESKTNTKAILSKDGDDAPYNEFTTHSLDTTKAKQLGYTFTSVHSWIYPLLDFYSKQIVQLK